MSFHLSFSTFTWVFQVLLANNLYPHWLSTSNFNPEVLKLKSHYTNIKRSCNFKSDEVLPSFTPWPGLKNYCTKWPQVFTAKRTKPPIPILVETGFMLPDENQASVPLSWPPSSNLPLHCGLGFGCVSARTGQHRIDYCWSRKTASQGRKEGWWWWETGDSGGRN